MNMQQIKDIAKTVGIKCTGLKKAELIRAIQSAEGNNPCFETGQVDSCGQISCLWKDDCK